MKRQIVSGRLNRGLKIYNHVYQIGIQERTKVEFSYDSELKIQRIDFEGYDIFLFRTAYQGKFGTWIASVYGRQMLVDFDYNYNNPPYPISYFK